MAHHHHHHNHPDESNPLLPPESNPKKASSSSSLSPPSKENPVPPMEEPEGEVAEGVPMSVVGRPMVVGHARGPWASGLCHCFGNHDLFCGSDLEVCLLGSIAPCVLSASNAERLGSSSVSFTNHCMTYTTLYLIGNSFFGWNCLAPWLSYTTRTAVRRGFNLEGNCEALTRNCGCCGSLMDDELQREQIETACDIATHLFCHPCSLCQEGREIRRRLPHPGFNGQQVVIMIPPGAQTMGRH
ncbi:hypothetical protein vseg_013632 [Gypsophila vaccaria]